jgi:hypothetical protein
VYYQQFVTIEILDSVASCVGLNKIKKSKVSSFNDIPLKIWDDIALKTIGYFKMKTLSEALHEAGEIFSLSTLVCIYKEAATILKEGKC